MAAAPLKVCIVGSGNWGSAVAKIIGNNVKKLKKFASTVKMWVFEETVNGRKLTDIINNDHENVKYLPGHKLPENVVAVPNLSEAVQDADLLVFVIPHQFINRICDEITGRVPKEALGITLIKGIDEGPEGLKLISDIIREKMGIDVSVLMGANIASEVAAEKFCETTIGSKIMENGLLFKELLQTPNFRITVVDDADTVELCGALKETYKWISACYRDRAWLVGGRDRWGWRTIYLPSSGYPLKQDHLPSFLSACIRAGIF
ncbi:glycerol-3-phosphate dehydrogenase 1-like protein [Leptonychotes weddellii]|uniref:glycerol-3-phosphate dehydrogenase (NAD(+)) n=1 Tax=Leptonychotes weddellii TaxID=9713 RepID=A0A2U3XRJ4_LEPWE|nr:glycerol-3-phosphate dehydrogenase 1-like protein [Leptonychotes weddellii]